MKKCILAGLAALTVATGQGATIDYTLNPEPTATTYKGYGFSKKETYDVAIRLADPTLVGSRITGIEVGMPLQSDWVDNVSGWLSTDLRLEGKKNAPDLASKAGEVVDRKLSITFDEPYTLTSEGVYVGYSFNVTTLGDYSTTPVAVSETETENPDGFFLHTSRTRLKWSDENAASGYVSIMTVHLEMDGGATDAAASLPAMTYVVTGEEGEIPLTIVNYGASPLTGIGYSWKIGNDSGSGSLTLPTPLPAGERTTVGVTVGPCGTPGNNDIEISVDTFNGEPNTDSRRVARGTVAVMPFMPVNRPLTEEFTGMRCGYCPRGYVSLEQMGHKYPDLFVGMAYHTSNYETGGMVIMPDTEFPVTISGYPSGTFNRSIMLDMEPTEVSDAWETARKDIVPADIDVTLEWSDENHTILKGEAKARFACEFEDADYRLALALVADGLHRDDWYQMNYYTGDTSVSGDFWEIFTNGGKVVSDITFNDVVVSFKDVKGVEGSVPSLITLSTVPVLTEEFPLSSIRNVKDEEILTPGCTLHAVGILIDGKSGKVVNCNKSASVDPQVTGAVTGLSTDTTLISSEWINLQGQRIGRPAKSTVSIRLDRFSDGTVRTVKTVVED